MLALPERSFRDAMQEADCSGEEATHRGQQFVPELSQPI